MAFRPLVTSMIRIREKKKKHKCRKESQTRLLFTKRSEGLCRMSRKRIAKEESLREFIPAKLGKKLARSEQRMASILRNLAKKDSE